MGDFLAIMFVSLASAWVIYNILMLIKAIKK
jgi:hypothetical protein